MNREEIVALAEKAGFERLFPDIEDWVCFTEEIERFYKMVVSAEREALAKESSATEQPAQQEPVAKVCHDLDGHIGWNPKLTQLPDEGASLYTSPQSRPWVGLTDEERNYARQAVTYSQLAMTASEWTEAVQIETERRLREKNA